MKAYTDILEEIGWPNIYLIPSKQFEHIDGDKIRGLYGIASDYQPVITVNTGLERKVLKNSLWHELAHHLWPSWRHWKVFLYGLIMARGGGDWMRKEYYGHTVDEMPDRKKLLHMTRLAVIRFNKKHGPTRVVK